MMSKYVNIDYHGGTWLIGEQFNCSNLVDFRELIAQDRLRYITTCEPSWRLNLLTPTEAEERIAIGKNVYADVRLTQKALP
jgi:hypothetical protein